MRIHLLLATLILSACGQNKTQIKEQLVDSTKQADDLLTEYNLDWKGYRSLYSDSLSSNDKITDSLIGVFIKNGKLTLKKEYNGGDCEGLYRIYSTNNKDFSLTVDKFDCGDYGFSNNQYLTNRDSVVFFREFIVDWYNREIYDLTERIITFKNGKTIIKVRKEIISEDGTQETGLRFTTQEFKDSILTTDTEYKRIKQSLAEMKNKKQI